MLKNKSYIVLLSLCLLICAKTHAQYGNEWINLNQSYYKIKIGSKGLYQIDRTTLSNAGFPVSSVNPNKIQIFHRGQEISIKVIGESDGTFDNTDVIQFYAQSNDGVSDTPLYTSSVAQPHTYTNLFSDSTAYFLTYRLDATKGKRMSSYSENNAGALTAQSYFINEKITVNRDQYYEGRSYSPSNLVLLSKYDFSEGWTGRFAYKGESINQTISGLTGGVSNGVNPTIEILLVGGNNNAHSVDIFVGSSATNLRLISNALFSGDESFLVSKSILMTDISNTGNLVVRATINGVNGAADRAAISYIKVQYPKSFNLGGNISQTLNLAVNAGNKSYIEIPNTSSNLNLLDLTDQNNPISIVYFTLSDRITTIVRNTSISRTLFYQSGVVSIPKMEAITFQNIDPALYNYLIVTHKKLRANTTNGQGDQIIAYKNYRESVAGGGHKVFIAEINQLFDQFNYGEQSPLAIKRFCKFMYDIGAKKAEYLFLIGKASNINYGYYFQNPANVTFRHLVPTYGYPGADVPFTEGFDGGFGYETLATGRINASNPNHVQAYLNKIIEDESVPIDNLRRKQLLHLSGGNTESELVTFRSYIEGFAQQAKEESLGGETTLISKTNNNPIQFINVTDEINKGVMMVTFFGHSTPGVTDIEIGQVSDPSLNFSNKGKYPVILVNGCSAGEFFIENESFGVDWILTPNLGATAFIAHSHLGFPASLHTYTRQFYELAFNNPSFIGKTVGKIKKETSRLYLQKNGVIERNIAQVQLMNLQGDPAVKVFETDKTDFAVDNNSVSVKTFNNDKLTATIDSFYFEFDIKNFGIYSPDPLSISIIRTLPTGVTVTYGPILYPTILREDTVQFTIVNNINNTVGLNSFKIILDPFNTVNEINESNNEINIEVFLSQGGTQNLLPFEYAIENNSKVNLIFQATNILSGIRDFDLEIDTSPSFNGLSKVQQTISAKVVGKYAIDLESLGNFQEKQVFYWRTKFSIPLPNESAEWSTSSFILDKSANEGWSQSEISQLDQTNHEGVTINANSGVWEFATNQLNLDVRVLGASHPSLKYNDTHVILNSQDFFRTTSTYFNAFCRTNSINFLAFDRQSTYPFRPFQFNVSDEQNALVCGRMPQYILNYTVSDMTGIHSPIEYINNLKKGDKVLIYSLGLVNYTNWTNEFKSALETLGINRTTLDNLTDDQPVIFLGAKNAAPNSAIEVLATTLPVNQAELDLTTVVTGSYDSGTIISDKIGPAQSWNKVNLDLLPSSNPTDDVQTLSVIGIDKNRNETVLFQTNNPLNIDLTGGDVLINADNHPYLRLKLEVKDETEFTPIQLKSWDVDFESSPEGILLKRNRKGIDLPLKVMEGGKASTEFTFWNISKKEFKDSLKVKIEILNTSKTVTFIDSLNLKSLGANDSIVFTVDVETVGKSGTNDIILTLNQSEQKEIYTNNNSVRLTNFLEITPDDTNPLLDVTFDGQQIMNGEIVSPSPHIHITLNDQGSLLVKKDTIGVNVFLKKSCDECDFIRVPFSNPLIHWTPATVEDNFEIDYTPEKLENGIHSLRVQASDASGNNSGLEPYEITFEVINESTITNFYPYPNPFSTSTRFVFTLTGSEIPEDIKIQIMTVTGRVVREIFGSEFGNIHIGNNISDFAWDGHDNFGDQLANGVYLYRVMIKQPGENYKHRETSADKGFKNGFGKMYLLR